jgi:protein-tyrosine phosphatase
LEFQLQWITRDIAIGDVDDARRLDELCSAGIVSILSLNGWPNSAFNLHGLTWRCVELIDGHGNDVRQLQQAVWHLHDLLARGPVLVHCMQGVSRSPLVIASYLADREGRPFEECLEEVSLVRTRTCLQPGLLELRRAFEDAFDTRQRIAQPANSQETTE